VGAVSPSDAWAVGATPTGTEQPSDLLIEHWDGRRWSIAAAPRVNGELLGINALGPDDIWAVGVDDEPRPGGRTPALVLHWDGTSWKNQATPYDGSFMEFDAVSALSDSDVWAVGTADGGAVIEHWNGFRWRLREAGLQGPRLGGSFLSGVDAFAADDVWAVGGRHTAGTLALHWDGTSWSTAYPPGGTAPATGFDAISATGPDDVWAVGGKGTPGGGQSTLIDHWDGTRWSRVPSPDRSRPRTYSDYFLGVSAVSPSGALAVGVYSTHAKHKPILARWDGAHWTLVPITP
jgi:hypothetical protein